MNPFTRILAFPPGAGDLTDYIEEILKEHIWGNRYSILIALIIVIPLFIMSFCSFLKSKKKLRDSQRSLDIDMIVNKNDS
jgi:hypothetical protein